MKHLSQEEVVLCYYDEPETPEHSEHLASCAECRTELTRLRAVLDRVTPLEVPDPGEDYESRVWDRLHWRLRGEKKKARVDSTKWIAVAAVIALAFVTGLLWTRNQQPLAPQQIATTKPAAAKATPVAASTEKQRDRILLVVVGDHFDESERILVELTNLTPEEGMDISSEQERAEALLTSNRLYRQTATERGEEQVATLLEELEPILLQIAHASSEGSADEIRSIQKRVEAKGLMFKLRVVRADVQSTARRPIHQPNV